MLARRDFMKAAVVAPVLAALPAVPVAWADDDDVDKPGSPPPRALLANEVLSGTLAAAGTSYQDAAGNTYVQGATYTGTATGTITGTFRADLNVFTPAGSTTSRFSGSLVIADSAKPSNIVFGSVSGEQVPATTGFTDNGRCAIDGGIGTFLNAQSQGDLRGSSSTALNAAGVITWTLNSAPGLGPKPGREKGKGHK
jgi:hypothetical protein